MKVIDSMWIYLTINKTYNSSLANTTNLEYISLRNETNKWVIFY